MTITPIDDSALVAMMGYPESQTRSKDLLHVSTIYKDLMCDLQPKRFKRGPFVMSAHVEVGILFESMLEEALARKFATVRPGEIVSPEGIAMSPDGVNPDLLAGEEYKCTWMSSRDGVIDEYGQPLEKFLHWFIQMKAYAKWLDVDRFLLRVLFVNGNYNRSGKLKDGSPDPDAGPTFKTYDIRFSPEEIEENWLMLLSHARSKGLLV